MYRNSSLSPCQFSKLWLREHQCFFGLIKLNRIHSTHQIARRLRKTGQQVQHTKLNVQANDRDEFHGDIHGLPGTLEHLTENPDWGRRVIESQSQPSMCRQLCCFSQVAMIMFSDNASPTSANEMHCCSTTAYESRDLVCAALSLVR